MATARVRRPVLILGRLDGIETGIRQLIRSRPLEVEVVEVGGRALRVPTLEEMARIKAWLVLRRHAVRDYLDLVALAEALGDRAAPVLCDLDRYYADQLGPGGRVATQLVKQLAEPRPYDLDDCVSSRQRWPSASRTSRSWNVEKTCGYRHCGATSVLWAARSG